MVSGSPRYLLMRSVYDEELRAPKVLQNCSLVFQVGFCFWACVHERACLFAGKECMAWAAASYGLGVPCVLSWVKGPSLMGLPLPEGAAGTLILQCFVQGRLTCWGCAIARFHAPSKNCKMAVQGARVRMRTWSLKGTCPKHANMAKQFVCVEPGINSQGQASQIVQLFLSLAIAAALAGWAL